MKEEKLLQKLNELESKGHKLNDKLFDIKIKWEELQAKLKELNPETEYRNIDFRDTQC